MGRLNRKKNSNLMAQKNHVQSNPNLGPLDIDNDNDSINPYSHQKSVDVLSFSEQPIDATNGAASSNTQEENAASLPFSDCNVPYQQQAHTAYLAYSDTDHFSQDQKSASERVAASDRPSSPLFDIELNIDSENTINLTVAKGEDYRVKLATICDQYGLDDDAEEMLLGVVNEYVQQQMYAETEPVHKY